MCVSRCERSCALPVSPRPPSSRLRWESAEAPPSSACCAASSCDPWECPNLANWSVSTSVRRGSMCTGRIRRPIISTWRRKPVPSSRWPASGPFDRRSPDAARPCHCASRASRRASSARCARGRSWDARSIRRRISPAVRAPPWSPTSSGVASWERIAPRSAGRWYWTASPTPSAA